MTGQTHMCLSVVLLVHKRYYRLEASKNKLSVVKPSFMYKINESAMKNIVYYVK